jgi:hypothetical protein
MTLGAITPQAPPTTRLRLAADGALTPDTPITASLLRFYESDPGQPLGETSWVRPISMLAGG